MNAKRYKKQLKHREKGGMGRIGANRKLATATAVGE